MSESKALFVLVVAADRVIATTLATLLHAGGYLAGSTASGETAMRIAGRMVIDAVVMDLAVHQPIELDTAACLQSIYPDCRIVLICSPAQLDQAVLQAEEANLQCEFVLRPLSRADLLARLAAAPGVRHNPALWWQQLEAA